MRLTFNEVEFDADVGPQINCEEYAGLGELLARQNLVELSHEAVRVSIPSHKELRMTPTVRASLSALLGLL